MPKSGITLITIIESLTVCIVTLADTLLSSVVSVARAWVRQVCHAGAAGSLTVDGLLLTVFFFVPQPTNTSSASTYTMLLNRFKMLLYFFCVSLGILEGFGEIELR
jgi:hypothetical protein